MDQNSSFIFMALVGSFVEVGLKNGTIFKGVFHTCSQEYSICICEARNTSNNSIIHKLIINSADLDYITCMNVDFSFESVQKDSFKIDTAISGKSGNIKQRHLKKWDDSDSPLSSGIEGNMSAKNTNWDQFETNDRLFGVKTDYNEEEYTTKLDKTDPSFQKREEKAIRLAREIEQNLTNNPHLAEERGQILPSEDDEEARYSSVKRDDSSRYVPPGARQSNLESKVSVRSWSQVVVKNENNSIAGKPPRPSNIAAIDLPKKAAIAVSPDKKHLQDIKPESPIKNKNFTTRKPPTERADAHQRIQTNNQIRVKNAHSEKIPDLNQFYEYKRELDQKPIFKSKNSDSKIIEKNADKISSRTNDSKISKTEVDNSIQATEKKNVVISDNVSENESIVTTSTSKGKFKLNVDAQEFTPSFLPPAEYVPEYQGSKSAIYSKSSKGKYPNDFHPQGESYQFDENSNYLPDGTPAYMGYYPVPFIPGAQVPPFIPQQYAPGFIPTAYIPPQGFPHMMYHQPVMIPGWQSEIDPESYQENGQEFDNEGEFEASDENNK